LNNSGLEPSPGQLRTGQSAGFLVVTLARRDYVSMQIFRFDEGWAPLGTTAESGTESTRNKNKRDARFGRPQELGNVDPGPVWRPSFRLGQVEALGPQGRRLCKRANAEGFVPEPEPIRI
jgi:hypothetical protein